MQNYFLFPIPPHSLNAFVNTLNPSGTITPIHVIFISPPFRPFGEAQVIERYIDAFLHHFLSINQTMEMSHDDAFLVCYSIIMLNVDQHSAQLQDKPKMTFVCDSPIIRGGL